MKAKIHFDTSPGVNLPGLDFMRVKLWLEAVAHAHGKKILEVNYEFCDDKKILDVNLQALGHDYFTDIITFDRSTSTLLSGDIYISLDTVRSNAQGLKIPYQQELLRVIAHGVLHLCGINDKLPGEREVMERHENQALKLFNEIK